jgi:hypothetical protein
VRRSPACHNEAVLLLFSPFFSDVCNVRTIVVVVVVAAGCDGICLDVRAKGDSRILAAVYCFDGAATEAIEYCYFVGCMDGTKR